MSFIDGTYRPIDGYVKGKLSKGNYQELYTSGNIDDEFWILLEYYSEVETVGLNFLKSKGIISYTQRKKVFKHFQAHVRQAKNYYYSAKSLPTKSSALLYYYCFLNLAKAAILTKNPNLAGKKRYHGIKFNFNENIELNKQVVTSQRSGVFPLLYEWYFGKPIGEHSLNIKTLLNYCTEISYQCHMSGIEEDKILSGFYAHCTNRTQKTGWSVIGLTNANLLLQYPKTYKFFIENFEKIELKQHDFFDIFGLTAFEYKFFTFFQSINPIPWPSTSITSALEVRGEIMKAFDSGIYSNFTGKEVDFQIALPYKTRNQIFMDEAISIYLVMFYLSNLVRYNPQYLEKIFSKKEAWLIDSFIRSCSITFIKKFISKILGTDYIIKN